MTWRVSVVLYITPTLIYLFDRSTMNSLDMLRCCCKLALHLGVLTNVEILLIALSGIKIRTTTTTLNTPLTNVLLENTKITMIKGNGNQYHGLG